MNLPVSIIASGAEINGCLNNLNLRLVDSAVLFCVRCQSIVLRENVRYHLLKIHSVSITQRVLSMLLQCTTNQPSSCYVKLAHGTISTGLSVEKFAKIAELPICSGFRCRQCNFGCGNMSELIKRHEKFQRGVCNGEQECFEPCRIQIVRIGGKRVGFGITEDVIMLNDGSAIVSEAEYFSARQVMEGLEQGRRSGIDSVESQLYRSLGWFRKNSDGTDFLEFNLDILRRVNSFRLPETLSARLLAFFKGRMLAVFDCTADIRLLLSDQKFKTIRPIIDQHGSYSKFFVEILRIVIGLVSVGIQNVGPEDVMNRVEELVDSLLHHEGEYSFADVKELWGILVNQSINLISNDLLKLVIRFKCFNHETDQLAKSSAVEQMAAKAFYFCRLFHLNRITNSSPEALPESIHSAQEYFKSNNTPFQRLCYLKGLAGDVAESEEVNPVITSSHDASVFTVGGIQMSPEFLNNLYRGLVADFSNYMQHLLLGVDVDFESFAVTDRTTDCRPGAGMRTADDAVECFLISQFFRENGPIRSRFYHPGGTTLKEIEARRYISAFDDSCRVLCALIHLSSGMPARATEICEYRLVNGTSARNIYFVDGQILIISRYNKSNSLTGRNNVILRFLPESISKLVAVWVTTIRPVYGMLVGQVFGVERQSSAMKYCFVKEGTCFTSQDVRECFEEATLKYPGRELKFSLYRHVAKHFVKNVLHLGNRQSDLDEGEGGGSSQDGVEDTQFGHSSRTADTVYGRNENEAIFREYVMRDFKQMSSKWHDFLINGIGTGDANVVIPGSSITAAIRSARESDLAQFRQNHLLSSVSVEAPSQTPVADGTNLITKEEFIRVKALLTSTTGFDQFKSHEQRLSVALSCFSSVDLLSIIPTGGGKSLIFVLYALLMKRNGGKCVVIIPTKSLQQQLGLASRSFGLSESNTLFEESHADIFFLTPEAFVTSSCQVALYRMIHSGSLKRIFVDEAHMVITDAGYRVDFTKLVHLKHFNVNLTFLSGSMSPSTAEELIRMFKRHGRMFKVIRSCSNRKNLCYRVMKRGGISDLDSILSTFTDSLIGPSRAIIYVHSIAAVQRLLDSSQFKDSMTPYCSEMTDSENNHSTQNWLNGNKRIMVATSGFGVGIDYPSVRLVVCFGIPYSMEDMVQQFGRSGRDGLKSNVILLPLNHSENFNASREIQSYINSRTICRRYFITDFMDACPVDCLSSEEMEKCDVCFDPPSIRPVINTNSTFLQRQMPLPVEREIFTPEGRAVVETEDMFNNNLLRCLNVVKGKCLICLYEKFELNNNCTCSEIGYCYSCLKKGHGSNSPAALRCPDFRVKSSCGVHYTCGLKFGICDGGRPCNFAKILTIFWRRKYHGQGIEMPELNDRDLKALYIDFIQFIDNILERRGRL